MKNILIATFAFLVAISTVSAEQVRNIRSLDSNNNGMYEEGEINPSGEYRTGPCVCYCPVTRFKQKKYCVKRCYQEPYTVRKKCVRYVNQPYQKQQCRYVNQYYTKTYCKKVPEYYCVTCYKKCPEYYYTCETKSRTKYYNEEKCHYVPYTCIERKCIDPCAVCPDGDGAQYARPVSSSCPSGSCGK
ncbi:MAG: hypothetical protein K940chlam7_01666 [Chlamydiae bacterium]|nr:hypothetical protein [Chlamydiota bacterium]